MTCPALQSSVLVLNNHFAAVRIINARRAFAMVWKNIAEVVRWVEPEFSMHDFHSWKELSQLREKFDHTDEWVHTVNFTIAVPRIIRLLNYKKMPQPGVKFSRRNIYARDGNRCQYCGKSFSSSELTLDHVLPRSRGGKATWDNIVCACVKCNHKKAGRIPKEAKMKLIKAPRMPHKNPIIQHKLQLVKYRLWRQFLSDAYWNVELKD